MVSTCLRLSAFSAVFDAIRADKVDDGIIQNNRAGVKQRGYLEPEYAIPTSGA
jgi:hypothetical protein